jgi:SpoVK/Ycf46/Vps4 family AAA+-type ATPase
MRKIKNEFMSNWDGLRTKQHERVLVLAATNRPFDLDEAVVRRLPRRLLVDLPDAPNRALILKVLLAKEAVEPELDVERISKETEGYSGSDLKQLCLAAAFRPIRELLEKEKADKAKGLPAPAADADAQVQLRPIKLDDFLQAKAQITASTSRDTAGMQELQAWNDLFGEGGSRKSSALSYFL